MDITKEINDFVAKELWLDFEIKSFDGGTLVMVGGLDLYYNWLIELTFTEVAFVSIRSDWKRKDGVSFIEVLSKEREKFIKELYYIEDMYNIFSLNHEDVKHDGENQYIVAATEMTYRIQYVNT